MVQHDVRTRWLSALPFRRRGPSGAARLALFALLISSATITGAACVGDGELDPPEAQPDAGADAAPRPDDGGVRPEDAADDGGALADGATDGVDASDAADASDASDDADGGAVAFDLYDQATIPKFELTFDADALAVLASTDPADKKKWVKAAFVSGGITLADVGVRQKGSSTFRPYPGKMALKVKFDKFVKNQKFHDLSELTLNNMTSDRSFLAERLAYHVFRAAGLPAQKANHAEVVVNGESFGLYMNVETPKKEFLERVFPGRSSTLYEAEWGSTWVPGVEGGFEVDVGDGTRADLLLLFATVRDAKPATLLADVAPRLDTDAWLRFSAVEGVIGHLDGYGYGIYGSHNYFMAGDIDGVFRLVPWSTDLTFREMPGAGPVTVNVAEPKPADPNAGGDTLLVRCKASAPCWASYVTAVEEVLATYEGLDLAAQVTAWRAQIDAHVQADPKKELTYADYQSASNTLDAWIAARPANVRTQLGLP